MSELFLRLGFGFWSSILKESRDLTTFAYCLCSSDIESMCSSDIESMCSSDIESMSSSDIESMCSSDISDIELSLFSCSWKEIQRKERELEANIKRPAEADKYKTETLAEANKLVHTLIHT